MSKIDIVEIEEVREETPKIRSLFFDWDKDIEPGQFVMIWIPGVDEVPMGLSHTRKRSGITVKNVGESTQALHNMEVGDKIGIRGPFGRGYELEGNKILAVVGGVGAASLKTAIERYVEDGEKVVCALGAETEEELLFREEFLELSHLHVTTDDGTAGHHGFVTELVDDLLDREIDSVITCGPEVMMKRVVDMCLEKDVPVQASLERFIKCGLGLCDSCAINGYQVCRDGPVFWGEELEQMDEFGKFERDKTGRKVGLD